MGMYNNLFNISDSWIFDLRFESFSIENSSAVSSCFGTFVHIFEVNSQNWDFWGKNTNITWLDIVKSSPQRLYLSVFPPANRIYCQFFIIKMIEKLCHYSFNLHFSLYIRLNLFLVYVKQLAFQLLTSTNFSQGYWLLTVFLEFVLYQILGTQCSNSCTLKGSVVRKAVVVTGTALSSSSMAPPGPSHSGPWSPVCQKFCFCCCCSLVLTAWSYWGQCQQQV